MVRRDGKEKGKRDGKEKGKRDGKDGCEGGVRRKNGIKTTIICTDNNQPCSIIIGIDQTNHALS